MSNSNSSSGSGLHHVALKVADFDATVKFYIEGLGMCPAMAWGEGDSRAVMLDAGHGNFIEIFAGGSSEPRPEGTMLHFALRAQDVDAALQRAVTAGATVTMPPTALTVPASPIPCNVYIAFCTGPSGETIEFFRSEDL